MKNITGHYWDIPMPGTVIYRFNILGKYQKYICIYWLQGSNHWRWWSQDHRSGWVWKQWKWGPTKNWIRKWSWISRGSRGYPPQSEEPNHSTTHKSLIGFLIRKTHKSSTSAEKHYTLYSPLIHGTVTSKWNTRSAQVCKSKVSDKTWLHTQHEKL